MKSAYCFLLLQAKQADTKLRGQLNVRLIKELQERQQRAKSRRSRQQLGLDSDGDDDSSDSDTPAQGQQHKPTAQRKSSRSAGPRSQQQQSEMRSVYQSVLKEAAVPL